MFEKLPDHAPRVATVDVDGGIECPHVTIGDTTRQPSESAAKNTIMIHNSSGSKYWKLGLFHSVSCERA